MCIEWRDVKIRNIVSYIAVLVYYNCSSIVISSPLPQLCTVRSDENVTSFVSLNKFKLDSKLQMLIERYITQQMKTAYLFSIATYVYRAER